MTPQKMQIQIAKPISARILRALNNTIRVSKGIFCCTYDVLFSHESKNEFKIFFTQFFKFFLNLIKISNFFYENSVFSL